MSKDTTINFHCKILIPGLYYMRSCMHNVIKTPGCSVCALIIGRNIEIFRVAIVLLIKYLNLFERPESIIKRKAYYYKTRTYFI